MANSPAHENQKDHHVSANISFKGINGTISFIVGLAESEVKITVW